MKRKSKTVIFFIASAFLLITFVLLTKKPIEAPSIESVEVPETLAVESPPPTQPTPTIKDTPRSENKDQDTIQEYGRPLAELYPNPQQKEQIYKAEEKALTECMNERGYEYHPNDYLASEPRGGIVTSGEGGDTQVIGYGLAQTFFTDPAAQDNNANDTLLDNMPPEQQQAWMDALAGTPPDLSTIPNEGAWVTLEVPDGTIAWNTESCLATAARAIYGDDRRKAQNNATLNSLTNQIYSKSETDKTFLSAQKKWRECVKSEGYAFRSRSDIFDLLYNEFSQNTIDEETFKTRERALAEIDQACAEAADLDRAHAIAQRRAEAQIRLENSEKILTLKADLEAALKRTEERFSQSGL